MFPTKKQKIETSKLIEQYFFDTYCTSN